MSGDQFEAREGLEEQAIELGLAKRCRHCEALIAGEWVDEDELVARLRKDDHEEAEALARQLIELGEELPDECGCANPITPLKKEPRV